MSRRPTGAARIGSIGFILLCVDSSHDPAPSELRASDSDRERVVDLLRDAASDGRLTLEEHTERVEQAYGARTLGELKQLTRDLVRPNEAGRPERVSADPLPDIEARPLLAIFGQDKREGRWVVPARQQASAVFGQVRLDFREALLQRRHVTIQANALFGSVEMLVPEGVDVRMNGTALFGSKENRTRGGHGPNAPVIDVEVFCLFGEVSVKTPKKGRFFRSRG